MPWVNDYFLNKEKEASFPARRETLPHLSNPLVSKRSKGKHLNPAITRNLKRQEKAIKTVFSLGDEGKEKAGQKARQEIDREIM